MGVGGHTQRGHRTPGALFWSHWLSTDPTTLRFALNNPVGPPGQQQGLCRWPGEGGCGYVSSSSTRPSLVSAGGEEWHLGPQHPWMASEANSPVHMGTEA